jgi:Aldo/keto reductase family
MRVGQAAARDTRRRAPSHVRRGYSFGQGGGEGPGSVAQTPIRPVLLRSQWRHRRTARHRQDAGAGRHFGPYPRRAPGVVDQLGLSVMPFYALAAGFLTGKYRPGATTTSVRSAAEARPANPTLYLDAHGLALLAVLDEVAEAHQTTVAAVSLAWLLAQNHVTAPIASARTVSLLELQHRRPHRRLPRLC